MRKGIKTHLEKFLENSFVAIMVLTVTPGEAIELKEPPLSDFEGWGFVECNGQEPCILMGQGPWFQFHVASFCWGEKGCLMEWLEKLGEKNKCWVDLWCSILPIRESERIPNDRYPVKQRLTWPIIGPNWVDHSHGQSQTHVWSLFYWTAGSPKGSRKGNKICCKYLPTYFLKNWRFLPLKIGPKKCPQRKRHRIPTFQLPLDVVGLPSECFFFPKIRPIFMFRLEIGLTLESIQTHFLMLNLL